MSTRQVDKGLQNYYGHKGKEYLNDEGVGKFEEWAEENGYDTETIKEDLDMTEPTDSSIIEFDEDFPTDKEGEDRLKEIFAVLQTCWKTPMAFEHSADIPTKREVKSVNEMLSGSQSYGGPQFSSSNYHQPTVTPYKPKPIEEDPDWSDGDEYRAQEMGISKREFLHAKKAQKDADKTTKRQQQNNRNNMNNMDKYSHNRDRDRNNDRGDRDRHKNRHRDGRDGRDGRDRDNMETQKPNIDPLEIARKKGYVSSDAMYESQLTSSNFDITLIKDNTLRSSYKTATELKEAGDKALLYGNHKKALKNYSQIFIHLGINGTRKLRDFCNNEGKDNPLNNNNKVFIAVDKMRMAASLQMADVFVEQFKWNKVIEKCSKVLDDDDTNTKALLNRGKAYRKLKKFKEAKDDLTKAKNQQLVAMEIEAEINSLNRNMQGKYSDDEQEEEEDYGGIGGIGGGIGGIGGGIGGIGDIGNGSYSFTTFSNNHYPKLPVRNMTFETWLKDKNKKRSIDYLEGGILYPVPSKKPQYRIFNDQEILDMALIWLDCDVFEKIVSLNVCDLEQQKKEYKGATYINQLSTGILSSGFKYEFNINKFNRLITCLCEADVYMESIDHNDKTPLANAITANLTDIANILLKYGADINNGSVKMAMDENKNKTQWVRTSLGALRQNCLNAISEITSNLYQINQTKIYETILNYTLSQYAEDSSVDEVD